MSVVMILRVPGEPAALEQYAGENTEQVMRIAAAAREQGCTRHLFAGGDGEVLVIDEWPDEASFQRFFAGQPEIPSIMQAAGARSEPQVSFYRRLDTPDAF